jgi:hypothetical protein
VPLTEPWCDVCWTRLPFQLAQPIQAAFRRDEHAYRAAVHNARGWLKANPEQATQQPPATLAEQLQDLANMLTGIGRHADHTRRQAGRCVVCSCGVRVQGRLT